MIANLSLDIDGVNGEPKNKYHLKQFGLGISNSGFAHAGGGSGDGKVKVQEVQVTKFREGKRWLI